MQTRYTKLGDAHVACQVFGEDPPDIVLFLGEYLPVDSLDEEPRLARALRRMSSIGRVIGFNRRGVGLSDPPDGPLTIEQHIDDALAVKDAAGSDRAFVFASNTSGMTAMRFTATQRPRRTDTMGDLNALPRSHRAWPTTSASGAGGKRPGIVAHPRHGRAICGDWSSRATSARRSSRSRSQR